MGANHLPPKTISGVSYVKTWFSISALTVVCLVDSRLRDLITHKGPVAALCRFICHSRIMLDVFTLCISSSAFGFSILEPGSAEDVF
jgi:hypothetical protein